jgi:predicted lipoprotein
MKFYKVIFLGLTALTFLATKCKDPEKPEVENYDKVTMLTNIANNYIQPAYLNFSNQANTLKTNVATFTSTTTTANLVICQNQWKLTCLAWQDVAMLEFGPANSLSLRSQTNIFPVDTTLINSNIETNSTNLQLPANYDAKGLQALDFLLFKYNMTNDQIVAYYTNTLNSKDYLTEVVTEIYTNASSIGSDWSTYNQVFIDNNTSNAQGSSVSNLVNALSLHYEAFVRKGKVGIPSGVFNGITGATLPGHVEGFYSGYSIELAKQEMLAIQSLIKGMSYGSVTNGQGLDDYLDYVLAKSGEQNLSQAIDTKINEIISLLDGLNGPLSEDVDTNGASVSKVYAAMQQLVPLIKVDMTSKLGVLISYSDNDGD